MQKDSEDSQLSQYKDLIAFYEGEGTLTFRDSDAAIGCTFEAGQLQSGDIFLICCFPWNVTVDLRLAANNVSLFQGTTIEGYKLSADKIRGPHSLTISNKGKIAEYELIELEVVLMDNPVSSISFGVTNFEFLGIESAHYKTDRSRGTHLVLPIELPTSDGAKTFSIRPLQDYGTILERIKAVPRGIDVTCEIVIDQVQNGSVEKLKKTVGDLCDLLSVARGTFINWIYLEHRDEDSTVQSRLHSSRVTRPFEGLPIIDPGVNSIDQYTIPDTNEPLTDGRLDTKRFIETAYEVYANDTIRELYRRVIVTYLDARQGHWFIETRSAALAIAMEIVKDIAPTLLGLSEDNQIIPKTAFRKLNNRLREVINEEVLDENLGDRISAKLGELNRLSFRDLIKQVCQSIDLALPEHEIDLFGASRNKLVHSGRFYCMAATEKERKKIRPLSTPEDEFFFLISFLDRVILKMFKYSGQYINWSTPGHPQRLRI